MGLGGGGRRHVLAARLLMRGIDYQGDKWTVVVDVVLLGVVDGCRRNG